MTDGPRLRQLLPADMSEEQRRMYDAIVSGPHSGRGGLVDEEGRLGGPMNTYLHAPAAGRAQAAFGTALSYELSLPRRTAEVIILTVVHRAASGFAVAAHEWAGLQAGLTHDQLDALRAGLEPPLPMPGSASRGRRRRGCWTPAISPMTSTPRPPPPSASRDSWS